MNLSLNETEAMAKRAARGARYPWGLAEEAGKAVRWLCANGMDGVQVLIDALDIGPEAENPILQGASLSDRAAQLERGPIHLNDVRCPVLLLPFAAAAARQVGRPVTLSCATASAVTDGSRLFLSGQFSGHANALTLQLGGVLSDPLLRLSRATPDELAWQHLSDLAHRTYAPATEESRRLGAGADLSDND